MGKHTAEPRRDGTCEPGFMRQGGTCIAKGSTRAEVDAEIKAADKELRAPKKINQKMNKRLGILLIDEK